MAQRQTGQGRVALGRLWVSSWVAWEVTEAGTYCDRPSWTNACEFVCVGWIRHTSKKNTVQSPSHCASGLSALYLGQLAFSNSMSRWARKLGANWAPAFHLLFLGGRMWPIGPGTKHEVSAREALQRKQ